METIHDKLMKDDKLRDSVKTSDPIIFTEGVFPKAFNKAAMDGYNESNESYQSLFEDKAKYDAILGALAGVIYREMRDRA